MPEIYVQSVVTNDPELNIVIAQLSYTLSQQIRPKILNIMNRFAPAHTNQPLTLEEIDVRQCSPFLAGSVNVHPLEVQLYVGSDGGRRNTATLLDIKNATYDELVQWLKANTTPEFVKELNGGIEVAASFKDSVGTAPIAGGRTHKWL